MAKRPQVYRDLAAQVAAVRAVAKQVPISAVQGLLPAATGGDGTTGGKVTSTDRAEDVRAEHLARRPLYEQADFNERLAWAKSLRGEASAGVLAELERARILGPMRDLSAGGSSTELAQLRADFPTFAHVLDFVWGRVALGCMASPPAVHLPPLLLNGPPGTGKTAFSKRLAQWLNVPAIEVDVATLETSFRLTGLDAGYSTGKPGLIWQALQGRSMSPVVILDELDKRPDSTRDTGLSFLLGVLEPASATRFQDAYVCLPVDASQITWIATCNDLHNIEPPLRSRFRVFDIEAPAREQMTAIINSVFHALRNREPWGRVFPERLPEEVLEQLVDRSPREVWQALEDACARAASDGRRHLVARDVQLRATPASPGIGFLAGTNTGRPSIRRQP